MSPDYWDEAKAYLSKKDKILKRLIAQYEGELLVSRGDAFYTLARSITGQQISVKAADSVWGRVVAAAGEITPERIGNMMAEELKACGLSTGKVIYFHALANHFLENKKRMKALEKLSDEEIIAELTGIKGIGRWTVEMYLIFHLGRPDVFPVADLAVLRAIYIHYNRGEKMPLAEVRKLAERWRPYRSVASWYLWRALDPVPVAY